MKLIPEQLSLIKQKKFGSPPPPLAMPKKVEADTTIAAALWAYHNHLSSIGSSPHTIEAFTGDIRMFKKVIGDKTVKDISLHDMKCFLAYLADKGEKPKSIHRRGTSLKNFSKWLYNEGILKEDPGALLYVKRAIPPLPPVLNEDEYKRLITEASKDSRDYVLTLLLLEVGLKRSELQLLKPSDINISNHYRPELYVRATNPYKQRVLLLPADFVPAYKEYMEMYNPQGVLFPMTERNLNLILKSIAKRAGVDEKKVSCQTLRDTYAVRRVRAGEDIDTVLKRLGLSKSSLNQESRERILRLAQSPF